MQITSESTNETLFVKKLSEFAILPVRGSPLAAGFDLAAAYDTVITAHGKGIVKTDLAMKIPTSCYGRIAPRSGLAWKKHIDVGAGVIDADYRGNVGVVLFNHGDEDLVIHGFSGIQHAKPGDLTFLSDPRFRAHIRSTQASVIGHIKVFCCLH